MSLFAWVESEPRWSFVIDTDSYAGNFVRELSGYVIGTCDEYGEHLAGSYIKLFESELTPAEQDDLRDLIDWRIDDPGDDGFFRAPSAPAPTLGYVFDEEGGETKLSADEKQDPDTIDYNSVAIFLVTEPTEEDLQLLKKRAYAFSALPKNRELTPRPKILGCRLVKEKTVLESKDI